MHSDDNYAHPGAGPGAEPGKEEIPEVPERQDLEPGGEGPRRKRAWIRKPYPVVVWSLALVLIGVQALLEFRGDAAILWTVENLGQDREKIWEGELWRLFTCNFLHGGRTHLLFNLLALVLFGKVVERWLGRPRFLFSYFFFTLLGSLSYQAFAREGIGIGASGAICGLIGVFLAGRLGRKEDDHLVLGLRFYTWLLVTCGLLWGESFLWESSGLSIADSAHFGGLFAGVLAALYFFSRPGNPEQGVIDRRRVVGVTASLVVLCLGGYSIGAPFMDWSWHLWRSGAALESGDEASALSARDRARELGGDQAALQIIHHEARAENRLGAAMLYWRQEPLEDIEGQLEAGFSIYDALYFERGYCREVELLLERLVELTDEAMKTKGSNRSLLNQAAWFRALLGPKAPQRKYHLDMALVFAREALALNPREQAVMNTLGWVHFKRGEIEQARKYLTAAVGEGDDSGGFDLLGVLGLRQPADNGSNLLYLALAYYEWHQFDDARKIIALLGRNDYADRMLMPHEVRLYTDLRETLNSQ